MSQNVRFENVRFEYGEEVKVFPIHPSVSNWLFVAKEEQEATLCNQIAIVAEKNGVGVNELQHLFPAILRMLKSDIPWSK